MQFDYMEDENNYKSLIIDFEGVGVSILRFKVGGGFYVRDALFWRWPWNRKV